MCTLCKQIDAAKVDAFGGKLLDTLNHGALALMISLGHRSCLFDKMAALPAATPADIAAAAELNERYVREWLGAMMTSGIVNYDPASGTYHLPAEHAALLTRAAAPNNFAAFMQYIAILGQVEDRILHCFKHGGGVPYSAFNRFHSVMAEDSGQTVVAALNEHILPLIPGLQEQLERGIDVLDVGCGRGLALNALARQFPRSRFTGLDFSEEAIAYAHGQAQLDALKNVRFVRGDAAAMKFENDFDFIATFDAIHDQARPDLVLGNIQRALRADGTYLMQDIRASSRPENNLAHPAGTFLYTVSTLHCMTVSLAEGGMGLGTMWGEELARQMLADAGFTRVRVEKLSHDFQNSYFVIQK